MEKEKMININANLVAEPAFSSFEQNRETVEVANFTLVKKCGKALCGWSGECPEHSDQKNQDICFEFLNMGFNLFGSSFFTALDDGKASVILAVCRTPVFLIILLLFNRSQIGEFCS